MRTDTAFVHPAVRDDAQESARHRAFALGHLARAAIGCAVLPAYVLMVGVPDTAAAFVLAWFLTPALVALVPRFTGSLVTGQLASIVNLALLISGLSLLTGGTHSFLLPWLLLVPGEAAFSGRRWLVAAATALGAAGIAVNYWVTQSGYLPEPMIPAGYEVAFEAAAILLALSYAGLSTVAVQSVHRTAERIAERERSRYRFLADHAVDMIIHHSTNGEVRFVSPACRTILGCEPDDLAGTALQRSIHAGDLKAVQAAYARASYFGADASVEFRMRHANGNFVWVEMRCRPVMPFGEGVMLPQMRKDPGDEDAIMRAAAFEIIAVVRDISERKQNEDALVLARDEAEAANRAKSRFLANMSHELRTPLNAVIGFSEVMRSGLFGPIGHPKYAEYADHIHQSGEHLMDLINDVLDMSKIEAGKWELKVEDVELDPLMAECFETVAIAAADGGISLSRGEEETGATVPGDRRALKQVLLNLLSNAVKFTPKGGEVTVGVRKADAEWHLFVADTGVGIPAHALPKLCAPFEQVGGEFESGHKGTGLGLALVKSLVELHGGQVEIASEVGAGTVVTVRLPAERGAAPAELVEGAGEDVVDRLMGAA